MTLSIDSLSLEQLCGQLLVVGFDGTELPLTLSEQIHAGLRGGVILFRRNLPDLETTWRLCASIRAAFAPNFPAFIGVDEEGGRVSRLPAPFDRLPPMRWFGERDETELTYGAGVWLGRLLAQLGFTCNFAPVLDVDSNPDNPVIGNRSFSPDPARVARHGLAFIRALQEQGIAACGKHFPGHGDTALDSHVALPSVHASRGRLDAIELTPFRICAKSELAALMTAHVVYPALDATGTAATFSSEVIGRLLRDELGFPGVIFSDDLEMGAVAAQGRIEEAAIAAVRAGCDALLICHSEREAEGAVLALSSEARRAPRLTAQIRKAVERFLALRQRFQPSMLAEPRSLEARALAWTSASLD